jgi:hypothetical protein
MNPAVRLPIATPKTSLTPAWMSLAHQASIEPDGHKLLDLVRQLNDALEAEEAQKCHTR